MFLAQHIHFSEIDSTNSWALRALEGGEISQDVTNLPILLTAERQTAGRGQKTRTWFSPSGCLMFSLIFRPSAWEIPLQNTPLLGFACANAILATLATLLPPEKANLFSIHWPNDIYYAKYQKISGILLEGHASGFMVAGIGINLLNRVTDAPQEIRNHMTSLNDTYPNWIHSCALRNRQLEIVAQPHPNALPYPMLAFLVILLDKMEIKFRELAYNPQKIITETDSHCAQKGEFLTLNTPQGLISGHCTGLSPDGSLLLDGIPYRTGMIHF